MNFKWASQEMILYKMDINKSLQKYKKSAYKPLINDHNQKYICTKYSGMLEILNLVNSLVLVQL